MTNPQLEKIRALAARYGDRSFPAHAERRFLWWTWKSRNGSLQIEEKPGYWLIWHYLTHRACAVEVSKKTGQLRPDPKLKLTGAWETAVNLWPTDQKRAETIFSLVMAAIAITE